MAEDGPVVVRVLGHVDPLSMDVVMSDDRKDAVSFLAESWCRVARLAAKAREEVAQRWAVWGPADQSNAIDSDPRVRWVPLGQANVGAVERRAPHFVPTFVALRQEQAWAGAGGELSQVDLNAGNLNGPAGTTLVAHQLHLSRFCEGGCC
jgi:hypothetical protein